MNYNPDLWVVVKIINPNKPGYYKVFGTWFGGYLDGDSWRLNSGIKSVKETKNGYEFSGSSGSVYSCSKSQYGMSGYSEGVMNDFIHRAEKVGSIIEILPRDTEFSKINYNDENFSPGHGSNDKQ